MPSQLIRKGRYICIGAAEVAINLARMEEALILSSSSSLSDFPCSNAGGAASPLTFLVRGGVLVLALAWEVEVEVGVVEEAR